MAPREVLADASPPRIIVEFFGIPRVRSGVERYDASAATLGELFAVLAVAFPAFAATCLDNGRLHSAFTANLNGREFIRDPATNLTDGDCVLILSADAGG